MTDTGEWNQHHPCLNPSCRSYGTPHINCRCYDKFAQGGQVCSGAHHESCPHFADGGEVEANTLINNNPGHAVDHLAQHHGLLGLLTKVGMSKSPDPNKNVEDFVDGTKRGSKSINSQTKGIFGPDIVKPNKESREALENHLQDLRENPEKMLDIGGSLGDHLPEHSMQLAATAGNAINHFNSIRPKQHKNKPLDELTKADKRDQYVYDRHLDIANHPSMILNYVKDGTLVPSDVMAVKSMYPNLYKSMVDGAGESLIEAKTQNKNIPYKQKLSLSLLLGEPLDSTMTSQSLQAIMKSGGNQQVQQQAQKTKKASGVELGQIDKVNSMDTTKLQSREMNKKD